MTDTTPATLSDANLGDLGNQFVSLLEEQAKAAGVDLATDLAPVGAYAAARAAHLATCIGQPGFDKAVIAERDNVALMAVSYAVDSADKVDARILSVIQGGLAIGAQALKLLVAA